MRVCLANRYNNPPPATGDRGRSSGRKVGLQPDCVPLSLWKGCLMALVGWRDEPGMMLLISKHLRKMLGNEHLQTMYTESTWLTYISHTKAPLYFSVSYSMMICCSKAQIKTIMPPPTVFLKKERTERIILVLTYSCTWVCLTDCIHYIQ